jgi:tetratricopeptide (TPR) repeat protein
MPKPHVMRLPLNETLLKYLPQLPDGPADPGFPQAVSTYLRDLFAALGGVINSQSIGQGEVQVTWTPQPGNSPLAGLVPLLQQGRLADGVVLIELLLSAGAEDTDLLYNLGMAYSDLGELDLAIERLRRLLVIDPGYSNGRVALGVALMRANQAEESAAELRQAVQREPENPWAQRNLGSALLSLNQVGAGLEHLRRATELNPSDPLAWYGLGQALEMADDINAADAAYHHVLQINEYSDVADKARQRLTALAESKFHASSRGAERMDAVMYCVSAMEALEGKPLAEIQKIAFEIAVLGTRGLDVNDSTVKYRLRSLPGEYSGLNLLCIEYVAFQQFAPGQDIGFDLSKEYRAAVGMYKR